MAESTYKIIELVGTSKKSWEEYYKQNEEKFEDTAENLFEI